MAHRSTTAERTEILPTIKGYASVDMGVEPMTRNGRVVVAPWEVELLYITEVRPQAWFKGNLSHVETGEYAGSPKFETRVIGVVQTFNDEAAVWTLRDGGEKRQQLPPVVNEIVTFSVSNANNYADKNGRQDTFSGATQAFRKTHDRWPDTGDILRLRRLPNESTEGGGTAHMVSFAFEPARKAVSQKSTDLRDVIDAEHEDYIRFRMDRGCLTNAEAKGLSKSNLVLGIEFTPEEAAAALRLVGPYRRNITNPGTYAGSGHNDVPPPSDADAARQSTPTHEVVYGEDEPF